MKYNWRTGRIGWLLNIHSPMGHAMENCWCIGTKRQLILPDSFMTVSRAMADMEAYYRYVGYINLVLDDCSESSCNYQEPHKHGFACDKTCLVCHGHYDSEDSK